QSCRRFRLYGARNCGTREHRSLTPIHPPHDGRQARSHATVARCDRHLITDSQSGAALRRDLICGFPFVFKTATAPSSPGCSTPAASLMFFTRASSETLIVTVRFPDNAYDDTPDWLIT